MFMVIKDVLRFGTKQDIRRKIVLKTTTKFISYFENKTLSI